MGVEFRGLEPWEREALGEALTGLPPALPSDPLGSLVREQLFWVEELLTEFEETREDDELASMVDRLFDNVGSAVRALGIPLGSEDSIPISLAA